MIDFSTTKATKNLAKQIASKFGGEIEIGDYEPHSQSRVIEAHAPEGKQWIDGSCISLVAYRFTYIKGSAEEAYQDLIERMENGIEEYIED